MRNHPLQSPPTARSPFAQPIPSTNSLPSTSPPCCAPARSHSHALPSAAGQLERVQSDSFVAVCDCLAAPYITSDFAERVGQTFIRRHRFTKDDATLSHRPHRHFTVSVTVRCLAHSGYRLRFIRLCVAQTSRRLSHDFDSSTATVITTTPPWLSTIRKIVPYGASI